MKRGFTLIELLGVIIILALLAILVFPSIVNSVRNSSKKTDDLTLDLIYNAASLYIDNYKNKFPKTNGNEYSIKLQDLVDEGLLVSPIKLSESNSDLTSKKCVQVSYNDGFDYELKDAGSCNHIYSNGQTIYFDVVTEKSCTNYKPDNSKTGYNGLINKDEQGNITERLDTQTSCLKFYAFLDDGGKNLNLLLDHNTTDKLAWRAIGSSTNGPTEVIQKLYEDTKDWKGTITPLNYTYTRDAFSYTIEYRETPSYEGATTPYKARLITAQEVAQITGADKLLNWNETSSMSVYYFDSLSTTASDTCTKGNTTGCKYGWLYDRTATDCTDYGCLNNSDTTTYGYWTSSLYSIMFANAWGVHYFGKTDYYDAADDGLTYTYSERYGVRPVITILKSKI